MIATIGFSPLVPWPLILVLMIPAMGLVGVALWRRAPGAWLRLLMLTVLLVALLDPRVMREERRAENDIAVIVMDRSQSQQVGGRMAESEAALAAVRRRLAGFSNIDVREISVNSSGEGTLLFKALADGLADIPKQRLAGVIVITDGQVHDVPASDMGAPMHVLLSGNPGETDRRLVVDKVPGYGIVGQKVDIVYHVEEKGRTIGKQVRVRFRRDGVESGSAIVGIGQSGRFSISLDHAGPTIVEIEVAGDKRDISPLNNRVALSINGVRDRLKVLLISGQPYPGERTWRNLLKSDPSVDLVHFTILRTPEKANYAPLRELSLITFPVDELFGEKLTKFDLVIFDRYLVRGVLPQSYLKNIADYLRKGGAVLLASGPEFAGPESLFRTPLGSVMPVPPTGRVIEKAFRPTISQSGLAHPVTAGLAKQPQWGRWLRQVEAGPTSGTVLMSGADKSPLVVLERLDKGRIAQLMSDQIWLWARGFEGGGPATELLRRLAHWLMKEPDLEEERLGARIKAGHLIIKRQSLAASVPPVTVTSPSGSSYTVSLKGVGNGQFQSTIKADEAGIYTLKEGSLAALAAAGELNPVELSDLRASGDIILPFARASGGSVNWIADGLPDIRRIRPGGHSAGREWIGLVRNGSYTVSGMSQASLVPGWMLLGLFILSLMSAWWREGR